jgi:inosine-uridine nucleoside N-ribohydrolase
MQQPSNNGKPPISVIFDSAMGLRPDDPLALALLYNSDGKNEARIVSISISVADLNAARLCAAISRFYRLTPAQERDPLPIGMLVGQASRESTEMTRIPIERKDAEGKPVYSHRIAKWHDTADPLPLMRNALASQPDQSVVIVLTGPATNLARLLALPGAKELIAKKTKFLAFAGGAYPNGKADPVIQRDLASARKLFDEWPTPIIAASVETGEQVAFPVKSFEKEFAWTAAHPVVDAVRAYRQSPTDATTAGLAAALYAVKSQENFFKLSEPGEIKILDDNRIGFSPGLGGRRRYLIVEPETKDRLLTSYIQMASARPIPPAKQ